MMSRTRPTAKQRRSVKARAYGRCEYCQCQDDFATESFSIEHIIPVAVDGETTLDNLAFACQGCNSHKYTKTSAPDPVDGQFVPLFHPRQHNWEDHFSWSEDFLEMIGLTSIGRATIVALKLNRQRVVNLRRAMYVLGEHPPL
ncbi:MAG: HNH endonuclease [Caldilineaceae bacterium]|nr:HNH endonuclease [Caldilineaceae bacterium]